MRTTTLLFALAAVAGAVRPVAAQDPPGVLCKELPCSVVIDWTRNGGIGNVRPDRRYGNPAQLEEFVKARLTERGYVMFGSEDERDLRIRLSPVIRNAMCDQMAGTSTDRSCQAVTEIEVRLEGPGEVTSRVELPARLRNRCPGEEVMPADKLGTFVADWIIFAVDGHAKGERRPVARC
jgi:hypothetical protein